MKQACLTSLYPVAVAPEPVKRKRRRRTKFHFETLLLCDGFCGSGWTEWTKWTGWTNDWFDLLRSQGVKHSFTKFHYGGNMAFTDALLPESDHEMANTRKTLERVPDDKLGWKP